MNFFLASLDKVDGKDLIIVEGKTIDMTKEDLLNKVHSVTYYGKTWYQGDEVKAAMDQYAKDQMTTLLKNISRFPVEVYSEKVKGQDKKYFLGRKFVEDLIKRIK